MKKHFISVFTAIALALPLGIGGLIFAAPVTATVADAQNRFGYRFNACHLHLFSSCDHRIQTSATNFNLSGSLRYYRGKPAMAFTGSGLLTPRIPFSVNAGIGGSGGRGSLTIGTGGIGSLTIGW